MTTIVTKTGISGDDWAGREVFPFDVFWNGQELPEEQLAVAFPNDREAADLVPWLDRIAMIVVDFPAFSDGRGFSIAKRLRELGFTGRLRAAGPLVSDQLRQALRVGFDEVAVAASIAARQPASHWTVRPMGSYQERIAV